MVFKDRRYTFKEVDELSDGIAAAVMAKVQNAKPTAAEAAHEPAVSCDSVLTSV